MIKFVCFLCILNNGLLSIKFLYITLLYRTCPQAANHVQNANYPLSMPIPYNSILLFCKNNCTSHSLYLTVMDLIRSESSITGNSQYKSFIFPIFPTRQISCIQQYKCLIKHCPNSFSCSRPLRGRESQGYFQLEEHKSKLGKNI